MFEVTGDDIAALDDTDLRTLVGLLCEAELVTRGLSPAAATWGGNQTAPDGGLDVRVELSTAARLDPDGFVPRRWVGYQVKKPDMSPASITKEMRPKGVIRPVIQQLADHGEAAYIIVSSAGSTADGPLQDRRKAMRDVLKEVANGHQLHTDFYDRNRVATWVRQHPGWVVWVRAKVGRAFSGWRAYREPWSKGADGEYLLDNTLRLHLGHKSSDEAQPVAEALDALRDQLAQPGKAVRLVGLSGVGKTRLVQALFDARLGARPLPEAQAVYTDLGLNPDPQPVGMASNLIAQKRRVILVVDNCPPSTHKTLADLCCAAGSPLSLLTVEYDVRDDDLPESTQVVTLLGASDALIEQLIELRYRHISRMDARTIAAVAGGNARIALALAGTVGQTESIALLREKDLFERLFLQRQDPDKALLRTAQICALLYSFNGEDFDGPEAELPRLAALARLPVEDVYEHVAELRQRELVQQRGKWRAVLPHAIANRLAAQALKLIPYQKIEQDLLGDRKRLWRSFSRRLTYLHDSPEAIKIVRSWLAPGGFLGNLAQFNQLQKDIFKNIAPVCPEETLQALVHAVGNEEKSVKVLRPYLSLLFHLAYEPPMFEQSATLLATVTIESNDSSDIRTASDYFVTLFSPCFSGTHATIEQRLHMIRMLLQSGSEKKKELGFKAFSELMRALNFSSVKDFDFGVRSRDYGYMPKSQSDVQYWYGAALALIDELSSGEMQFRKEIQMLVVERFRDLGSLVPITQDFYSTCCCLAGNEFWPEGWLAARQAVFLNDESENVLHNIQKIERRLRPSDLVGEIVALVILDQSGGWGFSGDDYEKSHTDWMKMIYELGQTLAETPTQIADALPHLLRRSTDQVSCFARGFASASTNFQKDWDTFCLVLEQVPSGERGTEFLGGFLSYLVEHDRELAEDLLDQALSHAFMLHLVPGLQVALGLNDRGVDRLVKIFQSKGLIEIWTQFVIFANPDISLSSERLIYFLKLLSSIRIIFSVILLHKILYRRRSRNQLLSDDLLVFGCSLLEKINLDCIPDIYHHFIGGLADICLEHSSGRHCANLLVKRIFEEIDGFELQLGEYGSLMSALVRWHPDLILNAILLKGQFDRFLALSLMRAKILLGKIPAQIYLDWCDEDPAPRYRLVNRIINIPILLAESNGDKTWPELALKIFKMTPDVDRLVDDLIALASPDFWMGSRSALMKSNAKLFFDLESHVSLGLIPKIRTARAKLLADADRARQEEIELERRENERFE